MAVLYVKFSIYTYLYINICLYKYTFFSIIVTMIPLTHTTKEHPLTAKDCVSVHMLVTLMYTLLMFQCLEVDIIEGNRYNTP